MPAVYLGIWVVVSLSDCGYRHLRDDIHDGILFNTENERSSLDADGVASSIRYCGKTKPSPLRRGVFNPQCVIKFNLRVEQYVVHVHCGNTEVKGLTKLNVTQVCYRIFDHPTRDACRFISLWETDDQRLDADWDSCCVEDPIRIGGCWCVDPGVTVKVYQGALDGLAIGVEHPSGQATCALVELGVGEITRDACGAEHHQAGELVSPMSHAQSPVDPRGERALDLGDDRPVRSSEKQHSAGNFESNPEPA